MRKRCLIYLSLLAMLASQTMTVYADCDCGGGPFHVIVDNWQTHRPRVTALRSLNAYLATDKGQTVYYIPTLDQLPGIEDATANTTDYLGKNQRFAAVYDGYFDQMCYQALVRKEDGTYSNTPVIALSEGKDKIRELTTLGYDFLLTSEAISDVQVINEDVNATYTVHKLDAEHGYVDLNTAIMDIYKAVGQEKYDITYVFTPDSEMTIENSPIQREINLNLAIKDPIDNSAGKAWVFATRTNPNLYWKQAVYDGVIWDAEAISNKPSNVSGANSVKSAEVTLADFCQYAYNIMNIYGEPVMTASERSILLQLYGPVVPYQACEGASQAIEALIAKGVISPEEDSKYLNWNSKIDTGYMLTLLMRIKDVNARTAYKDVQITLDASLIEEGFYNAELAYQQSNIVEFKDASGLARAANYFDYKLSLDQFERLSKSFDTNKVSLDLFVPTHLVFLGPDGTVFPLTTQVTPYTKRVYSKDYPNVSYVLSNYDAAMDGPLMQFAISDGTDGGFLKLRVVAYNVQDLIHSDGAYHLALINDKGVVSDDSFLIRPGGGMYYESGERTSNRDLYTDEDDEEDIELSNEDEIARVIAIYQKSPEQAMELAESLCEKHPEWTADEVDAIEYAASEGTHLSATSEFVYYMQIASGSESDIEVTLNNGSKLTLREIMAGTESADGLYYANNADKTDLAFKRSSSTVYQVYNSKGKNDLVERVRSRGDNIDTETAFCRREDDLLVSANWLLKANYINSEPVINGDVLMLSTDYANIYLDRKDKHIIVGACVYDVRHLDDTMIWKKMDDGNYYINFRAVLGWTGDYLIFKNSDNGISVTVTSNFGSTRNTINGGGASRYSIPIHLADVPANSLGVSRSESATVYVQGNMTTDNASRKTKVYMTSMYPFANYFIYMSPETMVGSAEMRDWLFVFKPKDVQVNGRKVVYDDTESRKKLADVGLSVSNLSSDITVWAYPLKHHGTGEGMPAEMSWSDAYGYCYVPSESVQSASDMMANYFDTEAVLAGKDAPECVLPFYVDSSDTVQCVNYNVFETTDANGQSVTLDYGEIPVTYLIDTELGSLLSRVPLINQLVYRVSESSRRLTQEVQQTQVSYAKCQVFPAVTSPALWFTDRTQTSLSDVKVAANNGALVYYGTLKVNIKKDSEGNDLIRVGAVDFTTDLKDQKFVLLRDTARKAEGNNIGTWFSVSSLTKMGFDATGDSSMSSDDLVPTPESGELAASIDVIDWDEFTVSRILETSEIAVAIAMIVVLNVIPRVAMFFFLLLIAFGMIQNVKWWQLVCDRVFDVYKFLTAGRYDVHTFRPGRMFVHSIIAMAIFALFMDGTIIHIYEWLVQFLAVAVGMR